MKLADLRRWPIGKNFLVLECEKKKIKRIQDEVEGVDKFFDQQFDILFAGFHNYLLEETPVYLVFEDEKNMTKDLNRYIIKVVKLVIFHRIWNDQFMTCRKSKIRLRFMSE